MPRGQLSSSNEETTAGRAQSAAQATRVDEVIQTIADRDGTIARLKREKASQFCALLDETKRKEDAERERDEYRQILVNLKTMLGAITFPSTTGKFAMASDPVVGG